MPEIIDHVFAKTSQNACFLLSENERFGLVFVKTGSINSSTDPPTEMGCPKGLRISVDVYGTVDVNQRHCLSNLL